MVKPTRGTKKKTPKRSSHKKTTGKVVPVRSKKPFKSYEQALKYLFDRTDYEKQRRIRYNVTTFSLNRMKKFLSLLGNPHKKFNTIHIAGTKGKGSTVAMIGRMLEAHNYKVGLYTSPHLVHLHERITVNSKLISQQEMLNLMNRLYASAEKIAKSEAPSFFEVMTALAFLHFADSKVDIAVIETGMGGRLDSTNVIKPKVIGITSLSIDHQQQLGDTLDSIALEKAGVFKKGVPVVTVNQPPEAMQVLRKRAMAMKAPLSTTGDDLDFSYRFETSPEHGPHTRICLDTKSSKFEHLKVPLFGKHQAINYALALAIVDKLKTGGFDIDTEKTASALNGFSLMGRMEMICRDPRIMIDAAHNAASIRALIHAVGQNIPYDSMVVIFGCNVDKDIDGMLRELQYGADKVVFTRSTSAKAMPPDELADRFGKICGKMCQSASSLGQALKLAKSAVGREDLICITGSIYLIGLARTRFMPD